MGQTIRSSSLVPSGFLVEHVGTSAVGAIIKVRPISRASACPKCGARSERIHSRYLRRLADLPVAGLAVKLEVLARRFHCDAVLCGRRIFAERFNAEVLAPWSRRTARTAVDCPKAPSCDEDRLGRSE